MYYTAFIAIAVGCPSGSTTITFDTSNFGPEESYTGFETDLLSTSIDNSNKGLLDRYKVLRPEATELPAQSILAANATKTQRDLVDKQLERVEKSTGTKEQNDITEKMRKDAQAEHDREYNLKQDEMLVNYTDPKTETLVSGTRAEAKAAGAKESDVHGPTNPALQEKNRQAYTPPICH